MQPSKILAIILPIVLAGCDVFLDDDDDTFYSPPGVAVAPLSASSPSTSTAASTSQATSCASSPATPPVGPISDWQPKEGHLVRAGDLLMELKRNQGGRIPTHHEMVAHLQRNMNLTEHQAKIILDELNL